MFIVHKNLVSRMKNNSNYLKDMPDVDERHTLLFSATMPDNRQKLAKQFLRPEYLFIEVGIVGGACQGKNCDLFNGK